MSKKFIATAHTLTILVRSRSHSVQFSHTQVFVIYRRKRNVLQLCICRCFACSSLIGTPLLRASITRSHSLHSTAFRNKIGEHLGTNQFDVYFKRNQKLTSMVSRGPPALSGWNWTPQTFLPESSVDLIPSTEESLQLMKKGSQPCGKGSCSLSAY